MYLFVLCFWSTVTDEPKAINEFDFKAIGSAELVQDVEIVTGLFTPGAPMLLEVKVKN